MFVAHHINESIYVKISHPKKSKHPTYDFEYPLNYGYVASKKLENGEELGAYVLGIAQPLKEYTGRCIGVIHRLDDKGDKLIVVPESLDLSNEQIEEEIKFQEKWFKHILIRNPLVTKTHFGVYGAIIKDGMILLIKKARGPYTGLYDLPGGSQEKGENYMDTLKREIMEETGLQVVKAENERFKSIIFSDFTAESGENGVLQHNAILYDVMVEGAINVGGDGRDSNGAVWVDIKSLTPQNSTPYALIAAGSMVE